MFDSNYDHEFITRTADAAAVMGQAACDYGPGSPEALGAVAALEAMHAERRRNEDEQNR
ncbi:hypothetical protein ABZ348_10615 [Streptomyces sp. NPDC005963]|uniref:hypothetical protein n=1 Tax=Streptomyces sp. NPDC005963 TaxID=3156721 RepID=UPI0033E347F1